MEQNYLQLQPRLQMLADLVPAGARLADVGTDHGYLPVWLLQRGRIASAIAADIGAEPLAHARATAEEYGVSGIDFRLCDGLSGIAPEETDAVVIAGMGGETIVHILEGASWTREPGKTLLLQPMTKPELLRVWLTAHGYRIWQEHLVHDKSFIYPILRVTGGEGEPLTLAEIHAGVGLREDPLYGEYLSRQLRRLEKALEGLRRGTGTENRERIKQLADIYQALLREQGGQK
jgi:tRNA (adenine22-N1)-methyltransferase